MSLLSFSGVIVITDYSLPHYLQQRIDRFQGAQGYDGLARASKPLLGLGSCSVREVEWLRVKKYWVGTTQRD